MAIYCERVATLASQSFSAPSQPYKVVDYGPYPRHINNHPVWPFISGWLLQYTLPAFPTPVSSRSAVVWLLLLYNIVVMHCRPEEGLTACNVFSKRRQRTPFKSRKNGQPIMQLGEPTILFTQYSDNSLIYFQISPKNYNCFQDHVEVHMRQVHNVMLKSGAIVT